MKSEIRVGDWVRSNGQVMLVIRSNSFRAYCAWQQERVPKTGVFKLKELTKCAPPKGE